MISYLKGTLEEIEPDRVVIETAGIGFEVYVTAEALKRLPELHQPCRIYTYLYVRENDRKLFGFFTREERQIFLYLIAVSGVGPKGAVAILNQLSPEALAAAVYADDAKAISKANGIGLKTAEKVIIELRGKLKISGAEPMPAAAGEISGAGAAAEAAAALETLGYSPAEAGKAVRSVKGYRDMDTETLISAALKRL